MVTIEGDIMSNCFAEFRDFVSKIKRIDLSRFFSFDITNSEFVVLDIIAQKSPESNDSCVWVSEIVDEVTVTAQAISKILRSLESKKYIERFSNRDDRRMTGVRMLSEGKRIYEQAHNEINAFSETLAESFGRDEFEKFMEMSRRFEKVFLKSADAKIHQNKGMEEDSK